MSGIIYPFNSPTFLMLPGSKTPRTISNRGSQEIREPSYNWQSHRWWLRLSGSSDVQEFPSKRSIKPRKTSRPCKVPSYNRSKNSRAPPSQQNINELLTCNQYWEIVEPQDTSKARDQKASQFSNTKIGWWGLWLRGMSFFARGMIWLGSCDSRFAIGK